MERHSNSHFTFFIWKTNYKFLRDTYIIFYLLLMVINYVLMFVFILKNELYTRKYSITVTYCSFCLIRCTSFFNGKVGLLLFDSYPKLLLIDNH